MKLRLLILLVSVSLVSGCGGSATGGTETGNTIAAAVASLFSQPGQAVRTRLMIPRELLALLIREAVAEQEPSPSRAVCNRVTTSTHDVQVTLSVKAGTYGIPRSATDSVTLTEADGCDQQGGYASFNITSHTMTCTNNRGSAKLEMKESIGVLTGTEAVFQIYGNFTVASAEITTQNIACHITVTQQGGTQNSFSAVCFDGTGNQIQQATDTTCH